MRVERESLEVDSNQQDANHDEEDAREATAVDG